MNPPLCPKGHGPMKLVSFTYYDHILGPFWFCVNDDENSRDYCDECEDYVPEPEQTEMFPCPTTTNP